MADGGSKNSVGNDVVELEAMRKDSFSWHPCQVSLCSRGLGLIVLYGNKYLEETITDKQEIFARIRVRSTPLQGDDCSTIRQGEHVLAVKSSHVKGSFYDARVEEVCFLISFLRICLICRLCRMEDMLENERIVIAARLHKAIHVRHSKRIHCRCSFRIKWLHQANEEEALTVPSSSIMKLAAKGIHLHPTISTFFSMLESSNGLDPKPFSMSVDGLNSEMDINVLLEKQIKEISTSMDISQEIISTNFVFRQEVDFKRPSHGRIIDASLKDQHGTFSFSNKLKASNGSENKQPTETTAEIPAVCIPSIEEEFTGSRLFLSPLAARAALASLRSEFPKSPQLSAQRIVDHSSNTENFSLKISATFEGRSPDFESIVKRLFPTSSAPQIVEFSNLSSGAQMNEMDKEKKVGEKKITQPSQSRLTRAQARKINAMDEATQMTNTNETLLRVAKTRRLTRSTAEGAEQIEVKEYNAAVADNVHTEFTKFETSSQNTVASPIGETSKCSDKDDKSLSWKGGVLFKVDVRKGTFIRNAEKQNYPKRLTRSAAQEETEKNNVQDGAQKGTFIQNAEKQNYPKRLTRSAAQEETEKNNVEPKLKLRESSSAESNDNMLEPDNSFTSPLATKDSEQFPDDRENRKTFTHVKSTPKSSESGVGGRTRQKSASSKKQDSRFSERLRFLPRTRSQSKA